MCEVNMYSWWAPGGDSYYVNTDSYWHQLLHSAYNEQLSAKQMVKY